MIIFGTRVKLALLVTLTYVCDRCGREAAHRVTRRARWFTLFFVPVFPFSTQWADTCVACGRVLPLDRAQAESVAAGAPSAAA